VAQAVKPELQELPGWLVSLVLQGLTVVAVPVGMAVMVLVVLFPALVEVQVVPVAPVAPVAYYQVSVVMVVMVGLAAMGQLVLMA
jgi:hypothetical protein